MHTRPSKIPSTIPNLFKLIYLNMWVGRPKWVLPIFLFAAAAPALKIYFLCDAYRVSGSLTAALTVFPFAFWFVVVPMAFYIVTYCDDRRRPLASRQLARVEHYMEERMP